MGEISFRVDEIVLRLKAQHGKPVSVIIVPGNHDCFIPGEPARKKLTDAVRAGDLATTQEIILGAQNPFWQLCPHSKSEGFNNKLVFLESLVVAGKKVAVIGFNSSWMSDKHEVQGQIEFSPTWLTCVQDWVAQNNPHLVITVTHHPLYWQGEQVHRELWQALEKSLRFLEITWFPPRR